MEDMVIHGAEKAGFPIFTPYYELTDEQRRMLWEGTPYFEGINAFFKMVQENQYKIQYRVMLAATAERRSAQMPRYPPEARSKLRTRGRTQHLRTGRFAHH